MANEWFAGVKLALLALSRAILIFVCIFIVTMASVEFIFAPTMTFRYYLPSLWKHGTEHPLLAFLYSLAILVQVINFVGSLALFKSLMLTHYTEKWFAFDTFAFLSVSISLSLVVHGQVTGFDFYESIIEKDIYRESAKVCTDRLCFNTDVYAWHQAIQCCGWFAPEDLLGLEHSRRRRHHSDHGNASADGLLPQFCCYPDSILVRIGDRVTLKGRTPLAEPCRLHSVNRFQDTCFELRDSYFELRGVSIASHPSSLLYCALKFSLALVYGLLKKHYFVPQAEGIFTHTAQV